MPEPKRLLILGGTAEARRLAEIALQRFGSVLEITTSLAGRTQSATPVAGAFRRGGFGGAAGLADYLRAARIDLMIDATHPFATRISANANEAACKCGVALLAVTRPQWQAQPGDRWIEVGSAAEAATLLPRYGRRVFLTIGRSGLEAFAGVAKEIRFVVRLIDPPTAPLPLACELVLGRGPFTFEQERIIIERYGIDLIVTKASGGRATAAKLAAARAAGIPVVMLRRPNAFGGAGVERIEEAVQWLEGKLGLQEAATAAPS